MIDGGPAFPGVQEYTVSNPSASEVRVEKVLVPGMSLRDFFAAKAMEGIINTFSNQESFLGFIKNAEHLGVSVKELVASQAYGQADAMLKERTKTIEGEV